MERPSDQGTEVPRLERELGELQEEDARLKKLLKLTDRQAEPARGTQAAWFDRAPGPVHPGSLPDAKVAFYAALFGARSDVYALRWENKRYGKSGWMPAVECGWRKGSNPIDRVSSCGPRRRAVLVASRGERIARTTGSEKH